MRIALLALLLLAPFAQAQELTRLPLDTAAIPLGKTWYGVYIQGNKSGYARIRIWKEEGRYVQETRIRVQIRAMNKDVKMDLVDEQYFDARPPYAYAGGRFVQSSQGVEQETKATRTEKGLLIEAPGRKLEQEMPDYTLADLMSLPAWIRKAPKAGDEITARSYDLSQGRASLDTYTVKKVT